MDNNKSKNAIMNFKIGGKAEEKVNQIEKIIKITDGIPRNNLLNG